MVQNKDGGTVCIGQAWEYAKAYGLMNVKFDDRGSVSQCGGTAKLVIGDNFKRKGQRRRLANPGRRRPPGPGEQAGHQRPGARDHPDATAAQTLASYSGQVAAQRAITIGSTSDALCLVRMPGETTNRSTGVAGCETANTLARGSDAAQVVAEAFLAASKRADFALQNAGGVRIAVPAGAMSMNTAYTIPPFTNVLVEMNLTGAQLVAALEDATANHLDNAQSNGSHPYAAGVRWDLDMSKAKGQRFTNVQVRNKTTGAWAPIDLAKTYVLVTNDFIAAGQDGYTTLGTVYKTGAYVNTYLLYTQSFVDYVKAKGTIARPAAADYSHQKVISKAGVACLDAALNAAQRAAQKPRSVSAGAFVSGHHALHAPYARRPAACPRVKASSNTE